MADFVIAQSQAIAFSIAERTLSGTVLASGAGVVRLVKIFRNNDLTELDSTYSASDGTFSFDVVANDNDKFRVTAIGIPGENALTYDRVVAV